MKTKTKLLEEAIDDLLADDSIQDAECGGVTEDEVAFWTYEIHEHYKIICCHYLIWHSSCWIDKSISEMEGPALLNCPIRFFNYEATEDMKFDEWRYEVKKFHEQIGPEVQNTEVGMRLVRTLENKSKKKH